MPAIHSFLFILISLLALILILGITSPFGVWVARKVRI